MKSKVSDFKLIKHLINKALQQNDEDFVDVPVHINDNATTPYYNNDIIVLPSLKKLTQVQFSILTLYISNCTKITNKSLVVDEGDFLATCLLLIKDFCEYTDGELDLTPAISTLNREAFTWLFLRDIIVPLYNIPLKNTNLIYGQSSVIEGANYLTKEDVDLGSFKSEHLPFIFVNFQLQDPVKRQSYVLFEALKANTLDAAKVITELLESDITKDVFAKLVKAFFINTNSINNFVKSLEIVSGVNCSSLKVTEKVAQSSYNSDSTWWFFGLIEQMLSSERGSDWSAYQTLKTVRDELMDKVNHKRQEKGLDGVPLESLLRVQSEELKSKTDETLQSLLSDSRIW